MAVLDGTLEGNVPVYSAFYYDDKGRLIQTARVNHLGYRSHYNTRYDFAGNVLASRTEYGTEQTSWRQSIPMTMPDD